jgi:hypothetical protein
VSVIWIDSGRFAAAPDDGNTPLLLCDFGNSSSYPGTGTTLTNLGTASVAGTLTNGPVYSAANGGILTLDGTNDYVIFNDSGAQLLPTSGLTVITWIRTSVPDKWILDKQNANGANLGYRLEFNSGGAIVFGLSGVSATSSGGQANGAWMMLSGVWVPSVSLTLRRNKVTLVSQTLSVPSAIGTQATPMRWGGRSNNADYLNGNIARLLIYGNSLSEPQLLAEYAAQRERFGLPE